VAATEAECVWVTHGYREPVVRWLREHGLKAQAVASRWEGESDESDVVVAEEDGEAPSGAAPERPQSAMLDTLDGPQDFR
jgi:putative mRNA 3-end processing factor